MYSRFVHETESSAMLDPETRPFADSHEKTDNPGPENQHEAHPASAREAEAAASERPHWQFRPGQSGNPAGRPKGSRNRASRLADGLLDCEGKLIDEVLRQAFAGDPVMLRACLHKLVPGIRRRPVALDLPENASPTDMDALLDAASAALAAGSVTPEEAGEIAAYVRSRIAAKLDVLKARLLEIEIAERERQAADPARSRGRKIDREAEAERAYADMVRRMRETGWLSAEVRVGGD
jgi:hypothetical protein